MNVDKAITAASLFIGFVGGCFAFADSWRTSSRFTADGVAFGYGPELITWWWRHCGEIGFALITLAFLVEFFHIMCRKK